MPAAAEKSGLIRSLLRWISGIFSTVPAVAAARLADPVLLVPALFLVRTPPPQTQTAGAPPAPGRASLYARALAARLASVACRNVPKSRIGPRRRIAAPAGKAIPKKQSAVLRRYKAEPIRRGERVPARPVPVSARPPATVISFVHAQRRVARAVGAAHEEAA